MRILITFIMLTVSGVFIVSGQENKTEKILTFEDALSISMEKNFGMREAEAYRSVKQSERQAARGKYLPSVSLSGTYAYMADDIHLDLTPVRDAITPLYETLGNYGTFSGVPNPDPATNTVMPVLPDDKSTEVVRGQLLSGLEDINAAEWDKLIQKKQFGVLSAGFSYPIYAGGKIRSANRAADIRVQEAENEMEIMEYGLKRNMVVKYYGLVLATKAEQVRQEVYNTMKAHLRNAERMKEEGMIANAEYLHAKVYYSEANRELKKAKRDRQIVHDALINSLTLPDSVSLVAVSSLFYTDSLKSLSYFKEQVQNNSPLLEKVHYKRKLSEVNHHVEKGEFMPTIAAMGTYELANKDLSPYVPEYMIGVGLKWDLFKGASRYHNIKASRYQIQQVEHIYHQTITDLSTAITKFYQQSQMHLEQIHEIETSLEFANEYYRVRKKAYSEGMATTTEVSDASLAVAKAKIEKLKAIYEFDKALINLLYYSGLMNQLDEIREQSIKEDMTL